MRNTTRVIWSIIAVLLYVESSNADEFQIPHVTVYGTATAEVVPDQIRWVIRVNNQGAVLEDVATQHSRLVESVLKLLRDFKLEEKEVQTSKMEFGENWEYRSSSRVKNGYMASTLISFKIVDVSLYTKLWFGLAKMSGVSVENVSYDVAKRIAYQNEARQNAAIVAKEKAVNLAQALGTKIGEPLFIEEDLAIESPWGGNVVANNARAASQGYNEQSEGIAPGTLVIKSRVRASFRLVTN